MKKLLSIAVVTSLVLAGCAKPPSKIAPAVVSSSEYSDLSCTKLVNMLSDTSSKLEQAEKSQRGKVAADAATVFFILIPVSSMAGDYEADVARYKGEKQALERTLANKTC
jgi:hypothetical protein